MIAVRTWHAKLESYIAPISNYEIKTMSFAIIQTGGKQYKVSASEILKIEQFPYVSYKPRRRVKVKYFSKMWSKRFKS